MKNAITNKRIFSLIMAVIMLFCVLPFNSVSFEADDIRILHDGKAVSEIKLPSNEKTIISVSDKDADSYQWQIFMPASSQWIDIYDKTSVSCEISYTLLDSFIDSSNKSQLRCEIEKNGKINQSSTLTVEITDAAAKDAKPLKINKPMLLADNANNTPGEEAFKTHTVTIKYLYYNESPDMVGSVANDYIATIAAITDFDAEVSSPVRTGYKAYLATEENWSSTDNRWFSGADETTLPNGENVKLNIKNIIEDYVFYVVYLPQPAKYHISTYFQNKYDDFYSFGKSIIKEAPVGSVISNSTDLQLQREGFTMLNYNDTTVAADGSTVLEIYYDREYHLINFELDGGYGVEPVYARYETDFRVAEPEKAGYRFIGWIPLNDGLTSEQQATANILADELTRGNAVHIPDFDITFEAQWEATNVTYNVIFWLQNADEPARYDYLTYVEYNAVSEQKISSDAYYHALPNDIADSEYYQYSSEKTIAENGINGITVSGDSSTVINVYYDRKVYFIKFYYARKTTNDSYYYVPDNTNGASAQGGTMANANWVSSRSTTEPILSNKYIKQTETVGNYTYYYFTISARYGQNISEIWPSSPFSDCGNYKFVSWSTQYGSGYHTSNANKNIKGVYSIFDKNIILDPYNEQAHFMVSYWRTAGIYNYRYNIYYENLPPDSSSEYTLVNSLYPVLSTDSSFSNQTPLTCKGVTFSKKTGENTSYVNLYYTRNRHTIEFYNYNKTIDSKMQILMFGQSFNDVNVPTEEEMEANYYPDEFENDVYEFGGWYVDPLCTIPFDWNGTMDDYNVKVYAKWDKKTHNVTFYETYNDMKTGEAIPGGDNNVDVPHGEPVNYPSTISRDGYSFVGWFYLNENTNEKIAFLPNNMPVNKDLKIYAEWVADKMIRYTIHYVGADAQKDNNGEYLLSNGKYVLNMGTCIPIADDTVGQLQDGRTKTFSAKALPELWDGYNTGYFPELASHAIMFSEDTNETDHDVTITKINMDGTPYDGEGEYTYTIEYTFYYVHLDEVQYTVNYINTATGNNIFESAENDTDTFEVASKSQFTDEAVTTERFKMIQKYVPDEYQKRIVLTAYPDRNIINFYYTKNQSPMFLVEHLTENLDGTWTVQVREFSTGNTGETISRHTFDYAGHVFKPKAAWVNTQGQELEPTDGDKWVTTYTLQGDNTYSAAGELESGTILVIRFYYILTSHNYTIEHKILGGGWLFGTEENSSETGTKKYGDRFEGRAKQEEALAKGYYVDGSKTDPSRLYQSKIITDGDNVITFYYVSEPIEINYRIIVNGVVGTNISGCYVTPTLNSTSSHASSVNGSTPHIAPGYYFDGWYADEQCSKKVSPDWIGVDNKLTPKPENGILSQATYYAKVEPCSLTITKKGDVKTNETFLFNIRSTDGKFDKVVSITGNNSTTIEYIPQGEYTITEISDWSWKYNNVEKQDVLISKNHIVEFKNIRNENKLLGDESNNNNVFAAVS